MDVVDTDDFEACASADGNGRFDYQYSATGDNKMGDKAGFKYSGPLSSSDAFEPTVNASSRPDLQQAEQSARPNNSVG